MKSLSDFKDEINKCSKCGLCQSVCPVFKETGNECAVSKGKFVMLDGVLKGDLKLNKNINKYLDLCLKCGKCTDFCPSGIDVCKIFETAKYEYAKKTVLGKIVFFLENGLIRVAKQLGSYADKLDNSEISQAQKSDKFAHPPLGGGSKSLISGWGNINDENSSTLQPFNPSTENSLSSYPSTFQPANINPPPQPSPSRGEGACDDSLSTLQPFNLSTKLSLLYFPGCVGNIFPHTRKLLKKIPNIEVIERDFDCCGIPFLSSGNLERYEEVKKHNLELMNCDFDYILTDCASCESTLKGYFEVAKQPDSYVAKNLEGRKVGRLEGASEGRKIGSSEDKLFNNISLSEISQSKLSDTNLPSYPPTFQPSNIFLSLGELLVMSGMKFKFKKPIKVTFHKPCHLKNTDFIKPLFENCENVEYIEMDGFDDCCGFAGEFALKNQKISKSISDKKAQNIIATGADYVITCCPSCILGLKQGLFGKKGAPKVVSLGEFFT